MPSRLIGWLARLWASPNSLLGILVGALGAPWGVRWRVEHGCIEMHGGLVTWMLQRMLPPHGATALTLGHVIWGQSPDHLDAARAHEHVHVRQYERWGPLFLPAYLGASILLWLRGRPAYRENPFEIEAYQCSDIKPTKDASDNDVE